MIAYWNLQNPARSKSTEFSKPPLSHHTNGHSLPRQSSTDPSQGRSDTVNSIRSNESGYLAPARVNALTHKDSSISESGSAPDSLIDLYDANGLDYGSDRKPVNAVVDLYSDEEDPEHSRWIHRDKLARIESQELQAAGIIIPRVRAASKSSRHRENSREQQANGTRSERPGQKRQRVDTLPTEEEENGDWDLRTPEEAAGDAGDLYKDLVGVKGVSKIPVNKNSPLPIPPHHLGRDTPITRKQNDTETQDTMSYPKQRGRSQSIKVLEDSTATEPAASRKRQASDASPAKKLVAKKGSGNRTASAPQNRQKKAGQGSVHHRDPSSPRPGTRSGELGQSNTGSINKRPEGDPPWLATMYKPDPRLPPDQQLLPTVARRLQQEQWEREGKFGNLYDKSFRPLNDTGLSSPEASALPSPLDGPEPEVQEPPKELMVPNANGSNWPLSGSKSPRSPALSTGSGRPSTSGGYSTMPKITATGTPQGLGIMQNPRPPMVRAPIEEEKKKDAGCGCCAVM